MKKVNTFLALFCALSIATSANAGFPGFFESYKTGLGLTLGHRSANDLYDTLMKDYVAPHKKEILIVGGVVTGLYVAYLIFNAGKDSNGKPHSRKA